MPSSYSDTVRRPLPSDPCRRVCAIGTRWGDGLWAVTCFVILNVVSSLEAPFGSSEVTLLVHLLGGAGFGAGLALFSGDTLSNTHFAAVSGVPEERGQTVCARAARRAPPGLRCSDLAALLRPLLLGSVWAHIPGAAAAALMVARNLPEDRMLRSELEGYDAHAAPTEARFVPGIWSARAGRRGR